MEKKVIRVGSVGVGEIWNGVHAPGIAKSPDLALVAICDIDEKKRWISALLTMPTSKWQWPLWKPASPLT